MQMHVNSLRTEPPNIHFRKEINLSCTIRSLVKNVLQCTAIIVQIYCSNTSVFDVHAVILVVILQYAQYFWSNTVVVLQ